MRKVAGNSGTPLTILDGRKGKVAKKIEHGSIGAEHRRAWNICNPDLEWMPP